MDGSRRAALLPARAAFPSDVCGPSAWLLLLPMMHCAHVTPMAFEQFSEKRLVPVSLQTLSDVGPHLCKNVPLKRSLS